MSGPKDALRKADLAMMETGNAMKPVTSLRIGILGGGDFGRALGKAMASKGLEVTFGRRDPKGSFSRFVDEEEFNITTYDEAIRASDVIVVAVPITVYKKLPLDQLTQVVIDCSNRNRCDRAKDQPSQAEYLQSLLPPGVPVVKSFNVLSAYALETSTSQGREVFVASDDAAAKFVVSNIIRLMGYSASDEGALVSARLIEDRPYRLFPQWRAPLVLSIVLWVIILGINFFRNELCDGKSLKWGPFDHFDYLDLVNKTCDVHAVYLLSLCYLPGNIAGYIQLFRGTKFSKFPKWLDRWLKMRKELGLLMLYSACIHVVSYLWFYSSAGKSTMEVPKFDFESEHINWNDTKGLIIGRGPLPYHKHLYVIAGMITFSLSIILGITSLPSVSGTLSWREFRLVQSRMGWLCLFIAWWHVVLSGWSVDKMFAFKCGVGSEPFVGAVLPTITIMTKIPLLIFDRCLTRIRRGQDRKSICG